MTIHRKPRSWARAVPPHSGGGIVAAVCRPGCSSASLDSGRSSRCPYRQAQHQSRLDLQPVGTGEQVQASLRYRCNKPDFRWRSRVNVDGERKTSAVCHCLDLAHIAALCGANTGPPFSPTRRSNSRRSGSQIFPRRTGPEYPVHAVQELAAVCPRSVHRGSPERQGWRISYESVTSIRVPLIARVVLIAATAIPPYVSSSTRPRRGRCTAQSGGAAGAGAHCQKSPIHLSRGGTDHLHQKCGRTELKPTLTRSMKAHWQGRNAHLAALPDDREVLQSL